MSTQPLGSPRVQFFDANGNPLTGGLLYTYAAGTTTPLDTYANRAGSVVNEWPAELLDDGSADIWLASGVLHKFVLTDANGVTRWTVDNYPSPAESSASTDIAAQTPGGRLTLTSGNAVPTLDVTTATTVYYVPYLSDKVPLYDGTNWALYSIGTGLSQSTTDNTKSPAAVANNSNYDLFIWNDSGTLRLSRGPLWSSDTARGSGVGTTELVRVNGRYVNKNAITNGPGAQLGLYVGTVRSNGSGQLADAINLRRCWNMYNRVARTLYAGNSGTYNYTTATWRQAGGSSTNQVDVVLGLNEDPVQLKYAANAANSGAAGAKVWVGIGVNTTVAPNGTEVVMQASTPAAAVQVQAVAHLHSVPSSVGYTIFYMLEQSVTTTGTTTWGDANGTGGMVGQTMA